MSEPPAATAVLPVQSLNGKTRRAVSTNPEHSSSELQAYLCLAPFAVSQNAFTLPGKQCFHKHYLHWADIQ